LLFVRLTTFSSPLAKILRGKLRKVFANCKLRGKNGGGFFRGRQWSVNSGGNWELADRSVARSQSIPLGFGYGPQGRDGYLVYCVVDLNANTPDYHKR